jgi:hypothetical protein
MQKNNKESRETIPASSRLPYIQQANIARKLKASYAILVVINKASFCNSWRETPMNDLKPLALFEIFCDNKGDSSKR